MASFPGLSPLRTRLAVRASSIIKDAYVCRRCMHSRPSPPSQPYTSRRKTEFLQAFRQPSVRSQLRSQSSPAYQSSTSPLGALSQSIGTKASPLAGSSTSRSSSWPETSSKSVAYWLLGSAASVFGIVVFGGLTRLTESGLSITEWRPVTGSFPPLNLADWESEFALYKASPEFRQLNSRMDLQEFKQIYWMEWTHRLWGRVVGITFLIPTAYFVIRRRTSAAMAVRITGICGLIGFQGMLGWWMVKSGLKDDLFSPGAHPRVSQYRLAAHLGTAFFAYLCMLHNGLSILREHALLRNPSESLTHMQNLQSAVLRPFTRYVTLLTGLVFLTALSGAFVAGLDAGLVYNNFPWMGQGIIPPKNELIDPFYSHEPSQADIVWRNMLENPILVQLDHRVLATTTFTAIMALWAYSRFSPALRTALPKSAQKGVFGVAQLVMLQVALGISTLWYLVPTPVASAHQAGALALLTWVFVLGNRVWVPRRLFRVVQSAALRQGLGAGSKAAEAVTRQRVLVSTA